MRRLIVVCEGETEREFCRDVLDPYLRPFGIQVQAPLIKQSQGGMVHWHTLKRQLEMHLKQDTAAYVTTFIDLYGIRKKHEVPGFVKIGSATSTNRVQGMESGMQEALAEDLRHRFLPYIQLHEFEALLFSHMKVFHDNFTDAEFADAAELDRIAATYPNPEDINDSVDTAPSKRLARILPGYDKVVFGAMLSEVIGMKRLLKRCPHFREWVERLRSIG